MAHDLNSVFLFIHPPLAILGFFLTAVLLFASFMYMKDSDYLRMVRAAARGAWFLSLLGLITGMIWAQIAWGRYWAWDPKETLTLLFFISMTALLFALQKSYPKNRILSLSLLSTLMMILTILIPFVLKSLHGYL